MPLKFCSHRWVENVPVCERGMGLLPAIKKYVAAVSVETYPDPGTKSYSTNCQDIKDPLLPVKLAAFLFIAKLLQPFLVSFRTDAAMIPFLRCDHYALISTDASYCAPPRKLTAGNRCADVVTEWRMFILGQTPNHSHRTRPTTSMVSPSLCPDLLQATGVPFQLVYSYCHSATPVEASFYMSRA